eukprot:SAG22_NODE_418_length_10750_cov_11.722280_10_plen_126_part_00
MRSATGGGGELEKCDGSAAQQWTLKKKAAAADAADQYQIARSDGQCIVDVTTLGDDDGDGPDEESDSESSAATAALVFDVKASLGWSNGAKVRDLWRKADLGVMHTIQAKLSGDGDSSMFRLSKA